jgi:hypothetical protein
MTKTDKDDTQIISPLLTVAYCLNRLVRLCTKWFRIRCLMARNQKVHLIQCRNTGASGGVGAVSRLENNRWFSASRFVSIHARRIKRIMQNVRLILLDWGFRDAIGRDSDFLRSLCNCLNSLYPLFMKGFAVRGRSSRIVQYFRFVLSSSIRDMLRRTHKKMIIYNSLVN